MTFSFLWHHTHKPQHSNTICIVCSRLSRMHVPRQVRARTSPLSLHFHVVQFRSVGQKHAFFNANILTCSNIYSYCMIYPVAASHCACNMNRGAIFIFIFLNLQGHAVASFVSILNLMTDKHYHDFLRNFPNKPLLVVSNTHYPACWM